MLINVGNSVYIDSKSIKIIMQVQSAPIKRTLDNIKQDGKYIDATCRKTTKSIIVLDDGTTISSIFTPETIYKRTKEEEAEEA